MKTIEERAKSHAGVSTNPRAIYNEDYVLATRYASYKEGATEQKAIDDTELHQRFEKVLNGQKWDLIDKACEWLKANIAKYIGCFVEHKKDDGEVVRLVPTINADFDKDFRKAMDQ